MNQQEIQESIEIEPEMDVLPFSKTHDLNIQCPYDIIQSLKELKESLGL